MESVDHCILSYERRSRDHATRPVPLDALGTVTAVSVRLIWGEAGARGGTGPVAPRPFSPSPSARDGDFGWAPAPYACRLPAEVPSAWRWRSSRWSDAKRESPPSPPSAELRELRRGTPKRRSAVTEVTAVTCAGEGGGEGPTFVASDGTGGKTRATAAMPPHSTPDHCDCHCGPTTTNKLSRLVPVRPSESEGELETSE